MARERHQTVAVDPQLLQALFAAQIEEIDNESGIVHFAAEAADQFDRGVDSAAGRQQIVNHQHFIARFNGVNVDLQPLVPYSSL